MTGEVFGAAMEAGRASSTARSSSESKPSTLAPKAFSRVTTPGAFRDGVGGIMRRGEKDREGGDVEEQGKEQRGCFAIVAFGSQKSTAFQVVVAAIQGARLTGVWGPRQANAGASRKRRKRERGKR